MRRLLFLSLLVGTPAIAAEPDWANAQRVAVRLSSFDYDPEAIRLRAGVPVILHLENVSGGGHDFSAPEFFAAARVRPGAAVRRGSVEVPARSSVDIALVPAAGSWRLRCTHLFHSTLGMRGRIVVE